MSLVLYAGTMLDQLLLSVPELRAFANLKLEIPFNVDSSRVGPPEWIKLAKLIHDNREKYDAFLIVHGTDTMAYTAAALSFMLAGFKKPIDMTGKPLTVKLASMERRHCRWLFWTIKISTLLDHSKYRTAT